MASAAAGTHLRRSFISWKAVLMCVWLKAAMLPLAVSSSASVEALGWDTAGGATRPVRHERQRLRGGGDEGQGRGKGQKVLDACV